MKKIVILTVVVILAAGGRANADLLWESGHHVFSEGAHTYVTMTNDASADITGGIIVILGMYNKASVEITGGRIAEFIIMQNSTKAKINGGLIGTIQSCDTSIVNVFENSNISILKPKDTSIVRVYGGDVHNFSSLGSSVTDVYSGTINYINAIDSSEINLHVKNYLWNPIGGTEREGLLTGTWLNSDDNFHIEMDVQDFGHINFIPEPGILSFLIFGVVIMNKRKNLGITIQ